VSAVPAPERQAAGWHADAEWAEIEIAAPRVAAMMRRYLRQLGTFLAPRSVDAADSALRQLARWMIAEAGLAAVGDIRRDDIEDYKVWLAAWRLAGRSRRRRTGSGCGPCASSSSGSSNGIGPMRRPGTR
jgi:hypothetical protein